MESEDGKTNDSVATVGSNPELKCLLSGAVKDASSAAAAAEAAEAPPTTVTPDFPAAKSEPAVKDVEVEVEAEMEAKEVKKVSETETIVTANGNADPTIAEGADEDDALPSEADHVTIPSHWHATPCVHITGLAGVVTEEDLLPLLSPHGRIVSIVFENERRDSAVVRYEVSDTGGDDVVARVREALSNTEIKDKTLVVEPFRPDSLLFIGNLTPEIDDAVLRQMFEPHGTVERAFVVRNAEGRSKGYGFVEYSLKSQASAAKVAMGNINMDGRVLRVEWSDCRKIVDMFSTVLFVDRIAKDCPHIEQSLKNIFGQYGKVRDCHLAIGMNQQFRGFAFIDFNHSTFADKAHEALDGREVEGSNIRVSFANPSKSAQSYKSRFGSQGVQAVTTLAGRGSFPDHLMRPAMVGAAMRGHMAMPLLGNRFIGQGRSNIIGMGIGMQFGRGAPVGPGMIGRSLVPPLLGTGAGMLGPGSVAAGMMGRGMIIGNVAPRAALPGGFGPQGSRPPAGRGPVPINSAAIAQVATAQAKAREEEAKARAEAQAKQSQTGAKQSAAEQERLEQFRKMAAQQAQLAPQPSHNYYQQQLPSTVLDQHYKQADTPYSYQQSQQQTAQQQSAVPAQYQHQASVQQISTGQQTQQSFNTPYCQQPTQQYSQVQQQPQPQQQPQLHNQTQIAAAQPQPQQQQLQQQQQQQQLADQYSQQQQAYYQQHSQPAAQAVVGIQQQYAQYAQQYGQQYGQQFSQQQQQYNQAYVQVAQQYPQQAQQQVPAQYSQQDYAEYYAQQQQPVGQQTEVVALVPDPVPVTLAVSAQTPDLSQQQQAYAAYYQQRAQEAVAQAGTTSSQTTTTVASPQQTLEAQWAAYYAAQSALQQVTTPGSYDQQQSGYGQQQQGYVATGSTGYYQQPSSLEVGNKRTADQIDYSTQAQGSYAYTQQPAVTVSGYTQQQVVNGTTPYQQPPTAAAAAYQQPVSTVSSYQQPAPAYQQHGAGVPTFIQQGLSLPGYTLSAGGGYQQTIAPAHSVYQQPVAPVSTGYQQTPLSAVQVDVVIRSTKHQGRASLLVRGSCSSLAHSSLQTKWCYSRIQSVADAKKKFQFLFPRETKS
ncbi:hypothetical protein MPTK1_7g14020 [Marchantia polymorpha subsp. ruderalis]|uniref:RRM domain-containing protein n=2 Tax=Marchantia polymorpha TaxID=3197 RepID=A0AAF6BZD9_MARPO|nr:hypothetical protein MARPO_0009s0087 [Marchantia polymorpha]BBN17371.1 hypothetical protein Mp_7g14020 [Marchantia polymorpha subsp. ruderalis]PTQ46976.1 hypothetical protein MARPO_0009s0087 [Marchantia polymorpha]PTQ46977.1 hypothetical protein MARPO_0009s0087 [Marchantia polymorpha]PTQ46978.1 hypothetical protein MARPO_0009s0087 [Marchantia polymorpha]|eukprot:PTQ46975.1 hypothetical protein MARPO_0009s0087 [Marchantia polymorpha]